MQLRRMGSWARPLVYLGTNPVSLLGAILTTSAGITLVGFWLLEVLFGSPKHPYAGIVLFLVLPGIFAAGLVLIPVGLLWRRRQMHRRGAIDVDHLQLALQVSFVEEPVGAEAGVIDEDLHA